MKLKRTKKPRRGSEPSPLKPNSHSQLSRYGLAINLLSNCLCFSTAQARLLPVAEALFII